jgi:hypothetical protein
MRIVSRWVPVLALWLLPLSVVTAEDVTDLLLTKTASPNPVQATTTLTQGTCSGMDPVICNLGTLTVGVAWRSPLL